MDEESFTGKSQETARWNCQSKLTDDSTSQPCQPNSNTFYSKLRMTRPGQDECSIKSGVDEVVGSNYD